MILLQEFTEYYQIYSQPVTLKKTFWDEAHGDAFSTASLLKPVIWLRSHSSLKSYWTIKVNQKIWHNSVKFFLQEPGKRGKPEDIMVMSHPFNPQSKDILRGE